MSNSENKKISELIDEKKFDAYRNALREDLNDYRTSLSVRLLALFGLLFTILQAVQNSTKLSNIFPNLTIINFNFTVFGINLITLGKLGILIIILTSILFFAFRAFFKFTLTSRYIMDLYWLKKEDFDNINSKEMVHKFMDERRWQSQLSTLLSLNLKGELRGKERQKMCGIIPYDLFMPKSSQERKGDFLLLISSLFSAMMIIMILW